MERWSLPLQRRHPWSGAMGIERAIKAMAPSAATAAPAATTATTLKVVSLTGETLLQEEPMGVPSRGTCSTYHMDPYGLID